MLGNNMWEGTDHYTFLGNCPPTPPLSQHFPLCEKCWLRGGVGGQFPRNVIMIRKNRGCEGDTLHVYKQSPLRSLPPIGIFHTLRKGVKTIFMGLLGRRSLSPCVWLCFCQSHNPFFLSSIMSKHLLRRLLHVTQPPLPICSDGRGDCTQA